MTQRITDPAEWLRSRAAVDPDTDCWNWTGVVNAGGYGLAWNPLRSPRRKVVTHRISYEIFVGPIPEGLQLDHLCRNRLCCNPTHVEPVTPAQNVQRGLCVDLKETCAQGHPFTPENVYIAPGTGWRSCRTCRTKSANERNPITNAATADARRRRREAQSCMVCGTSLAGSLRLALYCSDRCGQRYRAARRRSA